MSKEDRMNRRMVFAEAMPVGSVALVYSGKPVQMSLDADFPYYPDNNYRYLTGLKEEGGVLALVKKGEDEFSEALFIPTPDYDREKWTGVLMRPDQAREISGIDEIYPVEDMEDLLLPQLNELDNLMMDEGQAPSQKLTFTDEVFKARVGEMNLIDSSDLLAKLRLKKEPWEIEKMMKAVEITKKALDAVLEALHPGMMEYEISSLFEYIVKKNGAELSFPTIAASGKNGPILHYETNREKLKRKTLLLLDLGARVDGYCADVSRTYPVSGYFTSEQKKLYNVVLSVEEEMIREYKAGAKLKELQKMTIEKYEHYLPQSGFPIPEEGIGAWYYHSIGHSLGMDTHDGINRDLILEPGMVITCEPGIYLKELEIGIRIEDDILITEDGPVNLTRSIPKTVEEIEHLMRR